MSLILSANQLGTPQILQTLIASHRLRSNRSATSKRGHFRGLSSKKAGIPGLTGEFSRIHSSKSTEKSNQTSSEVNLEYKQWSILRAWDVPWDWKVVLYVMTPYLMSILLTGIVESAGLGVLKSQSGNVQTHLQSVDEEALRLLIDQLLKTVIKLSVLYVFVSPYQPFPEDIFSYRWAKPFNLLNGWIIWGIGGLIVASSTVLLVKACISGPSASQMQNEAESLVRLLPLIGASNISTASLLGILGILSPLCEETLYRGFLMTSLTKWLPVHLSVVVSSVVFTLAHQSPGKSIEIFIFGMVLGLVYAQTRNLLAPITMHACWNLGVIFTLIYFQSQGYDIQKYVL